MPRNLVLILGSSAAMLLGALAGSALAEAGPPPSPKQAVPVGNLGDEITYARFSRHGETEEWVPAGTEIFLVNGTARTPDEYGNFHEAVVVLHQPAASDVVRAKVYADLTTRDVLRADSLDDCRPDDVYWWHDFGPPLDAAMLRELNATVDAVTILKAQGQAYEPGQDLSGALHESFVSEWGLMDPGVQELRFAAAVEGVGSMGGDLVLELRLEGKILFAAARGSLDLPEGAPLVCGDYPDRYRFLSFEVPLEATVAFERSIWVGNSSAYPLLIHDRADIEGIGHREVLRSMVGVEPGSDPIPWGRDAALEHYATRNTQGERGSSDVRHPEEGLPSRLCFPMEDALREIETRPEYAPFQGWRAAHPDSFLVGFSVGCDEFYGWRFLFGSSAGDAYSVSYGPDEQARPPDQRAQGVLSDARSEGVFPAGFVDLGAFQGTLLTLGAVREVFDAIADPGLEPGAGEESDDGVYYWWGYQGALAGGFIRTVAGDPRTISILGDDRTRTADGSERYVGTELELDVLTGKLLWAYDNFYAPSTSPSPPHEEVLRRVGAVVAGPAQVQEVPRYTGPPPNLVGAAIGSSSLLALFLLSYFYPVLKFAAAQAAIGLPGYAKIRRNQVLNNRVRDELLARIKADPGVSPPELAKHVGVVWSTLVYHLGVLEKNKMVSSLIDGRHKRFFPTESVDWSRRGQLAALRNQRTKLLYDLVRDEPGIGRGVLAQRIGVTIPAALWHLDRLRAAGLVGQDREGRKVRYFANEAGGGPAPYDTRAAVEVA